MHTATYAHTDPNRRSVSVRTVVSVHSFEREGRITHQDIHNRPGEVCNFYVFTDSNGHPFHTGTYAGDVPARKISAMKFKNKIQVGDDVFLRCVHPTAEPTNGTAPTANATADASCAGRIAPFLKNESDAAWPTTTTPPPHDAWWRYVAISVGALALMLLLWLTALRMSPAVAEEHSGCHKWAFCGCMETGVLPPTVIRGFPEGCWRADIMGVSSSPPADLIQEAY